MSDATAKPRFLARHSFFGLKNYFLIILVVTFILPVITRGARYAINSNNNDIKEWLPEGYEESTVLKWFQRHFLGEQFALVSWDGCTLGDTNKLDLLSAKLVPQDATAEPGAEVVADLSETQRLFKRVTTGPSTLAQLTSPPLNLSYQQALDRLEGALVGPQPEGGSDDDRVTCLVVTLSEFAKQDNKHKEMAINAIKQAAKDCAIAPAALKMGGPPVDNVAIDEEGRRTLVRLAVLAGIVGFALSYMCFRSVTLTLMVFAVGVLSAGLSLAMVYYFGLFEVFGLNMSKPRLGTVDAILMSMPAVVYVLGLSGAIHIVNYYRDARREHGINGAAERAVAHAWVPCTIAALTTAVGLGSLYISDIIPIKKFGLFSAIGVVATLSLLFSLLPACLYRFAPAEQGERHQTHLSNRLFGFFINRIGPWILRHHALVAISASIVMVAIGLGLAQTRTRVQLLKLFDEHADIIGDYTWLEAHLGKLVPMEVVVQVDPARQRLGTEDAETGGQVYRMTLLERMKLVQRVQDRIESLDKVGRALSATTFAPDLDIDRSTLERVVGMNREFVINERLEQNRQLLLAEDYLRDEVPADADGQDGANTQDVPNGQDAESPPPRRELWRISARVGALDDDLDYGTFVHDLKAVVDPVLAAYDQRDLVLRRLHADGKRLRKSRICVVENIPPQAVDSEVLPGQLVGKLLYEGGAQVTALNLAKLSPQQLAGPKLDRLRKALAQMDCVVVADSGGQALGTLLEGHPLRIDLPQPAVPAPGAASTVAPVAATGVARAAAPAVAHSGPAHAAEPAVAEHAPLPIEAAYTGIVPLVYKTQRQLLVSLAESIAMACVLIAGVMMLVLRGFSAGLVSMIPNLFPILIVFGAMGWLRIKIDIGIMMTASVALGVAVDDTIHYLTWFRDGLRLGLDRRAAAMLAYQRCGSAMIQTTLIAGLGLSVFAVSSFTPTQQFGVLMVTLLVAALVGDLVFLPALLVGPLGRCFRGSSTLLAAGDPDAATMAAEAAEAVGGPAPHLQIRHDAPHSARLPY